MSRCKHKMVEVYRAAGDMEAHVIKGLLESYAIPCLLKSVAAPSVHSFAVDGMGEVKIMVWEQNAEEARRLTRREDNV
ncbi:DUF2007 domain-containing protein [Chloroflexota bacterium]